MGLIDFSAFLDYLGIIFTLVGRGLRLDPAAYQQVYAYTGETLGIMFWIVLIAGISTLLGQSITLIANRVSRGRFWLSILFGALKFVFEALLIALIVWIIANLIGAKDWGFVGISRAVALAYAPYWLGFLLFLPYLGILLERFLKIYVFVALVVALQAVFSISFVGALIAAFAAVTISQVTTVFLGRWLTPLAQRINHRIFGDQQIKNSNAILEEFIKNNPSLAKMKEG